MYTIQSYLDSNLLVFKAKRIKTRKIEIEIAKYSVASFDNETICNIYDYVTKITKSMIVIE